MLSNYAQALNNELTSNFSIYEATSDFKVLINAGLPESVNVDSTAVYEKLFSSKKNQFNFAVAALERFYGSISDETKQELKKVFDGDFSGVKSRSPEATKLISILLQLIDVIDSGDSKTIISSVRDADAEFSRLRTMLQKLMGAFKKEDADKFEVVSKLYGYFKSRNPRLFKSLITQYGALLDKAQGKIDGELDYLKAMKVSKPTVAKILEDFNTNEADYVEFIKEISEISPSLFGADITSINDIITDQISDNEVDTYKHLITFYFKHLPALVELAYSDLTEIANKYSAVDDDNISSIRTAISERFGETSIILENFKGSKAYIVAFDYNGRYEDILDFVYDEGELKFNAVTVLMNIPDSGKDALTNKSLPFIIVSLSDDIDSGIDAYGTKAGIKMIRHNGETMVELLRTSKKMQVDKDSSKVKYIALLACMNGFDAMKLPFMQKFVG